MARTVHRLTAVGINRLKAPGFYSDGGNLNFRIADGGSRSWVFRFAKNGRTRDAGLGPYPEVSLADARIKAFEWRKLLVAGIDPLDQRNAARASDLVAASKSITFDDCLTGYVAAHESGWRSVKHAKQWRASLTAYASPVFGRLPVSAIDTGMVMRVLEPIWAAKPTTASRVRGRIENVLDWAKVRGYRRDENPARWKGHLDHLLPSKSKVQAIEHHAAMPYAEIGGFMAQLRERPNVSARALEFLILTGARSGEAIGCCWTEIDLAAKVWGVPASRMKAKREHRVPLTAAALAILKAMKAIRQSDYVFPGIAGERLGINSLHLLLSTMGEGVSVHGFRSTFRDWAAERTNFPRELAEKALAHTVGDETERAYQRGDLLEKRRKLMEAWAEFCGKPRCERQGGVDCGAQVRGDDDLAKAKILLACATRVYGPNEEADEYNRFLKMGCKIAGIEIETLGQVSVEEVVATMLAEDREAARAAQVPPKRGRPPTPHRHLWITASIEAYRGMGLRRKAAEIRAVREWDLHPSTIGKIYKVNKELKPISKEMRALFDRDSKEGIDEAIRQFRESGRQPRINTPLFEINTPLVPFGIAPDHC